MKNAIHERRVWLSAAMLLAMLGMWGGCHPVSPLDGDDDESGSGLTEQEVAGAIGEVHPLMADIPPIPIPEELLNRQDPDAQNALDIFNAINAFTDSSLFAPTSAAKAARQLKDTNGWEEKCFDFFPATCIYTREQGDFTETVTHIVGMPEQWVWLLEWDGCDGEHEYSSFTLQHWMMKKDLTLFVYNHYQYPDPPACGGDGQPTQGVGPGPLYTWTFEIHNEGTFYTLWDSFDLVTREYSTMTYAYDGIMGAHLPFTLHTCTSYPDGSSEFEHHIQDVSTRTLYRWYRGVWTSDHRYCWTTYREDGSVMDCGGDMGCSDCGP